MREKDVARTLEMPGDYHRVLVGLKIKDNQSFHQLKNSTEGEVGRYQ